MKRPIAHRSPRATLAQKRALIRTLIDQTGWVEAAPESASPDADHEAAIIYMTREAAIRRKPREVNSEPCNIIPFPVGGDVSAENR